MKYTQLSVLGCNLKAGLKVQFKQQRQKRCWKLRIKNIMLKGGAISGSVSRTTENKVLLLYYFLLRALLLLGRNNPKEIQWFELCTSSLLKQNSCFINMILGWVIGSLWNLQESPISSPRPGAALTMSQMGYSFSSFAPHCCCFFHRLSLTCWFLVTAIFSTIY